jgi:hypothetical protein
VIDPGNLADVGMEKDEGRGGGIRTGKARQLWEGEYWARLDRQPFWGLSAVVDTSEALHGHKVVHLEQLEGRGIADEDLKGGRRGVDIIDKRIVMHPTYWNDKTWRGWSEMAVARPVRGVDVLLVWMNCDGFGGGLLMMDTRLYGINAVGRIVEVQ